MILELDAVGKRLGGQAVLVDCGLRLEPGQCAVVTGENGAGKSTLLRLVAGVVEPSAGKIFVGGYDVQRQPRAAKAQLSYVPDGLDALPDLLVSEFLALVRALQASDRFDEQRVRSWHTALGIQGVFGQRLPSLSFGQRKRVVLAAGLQNDPPLLLLDEPTNGLDPVGAALVVEWIAERSARRQCTLCTTNDPQFLQVVSGEQYCLAGGQLSRRQAVESG